MPHTCARMHLGFVQATAKLKYGRMVTPYQFPIDLGAGVCRSNRENNLKSESLNLRTHRSTGVHRSFRRFAGRMNRIPNPPQLSNANAALPFSHSRAEILEKQAISQSHVIIREDWGSESLRERERERLPHSQRQKLRLLPEGSMC
jgi:hypothetical protein